MWNSKLCPCELMYTPSNIYFCFLIGTFKGDLYSFCKASQVTRRNRLSFMLMEINYVLFYLPQEEEKNLQKIFTTSIIFDFISNYTNYIHIFITLFPTGYFLAADLSTG